MLIRPLVTLANIDSLRIATAALLYAEHRGAAREGRVAEPRP